MVAIDKLLAPTADTDQSAPASGGPGSFSVELLAAVMAAAATPSQATAPPVVAPAPDAATPSVIDIIPLDPAAIDTAPPEAVAAVCTGLAVATDATGEPAARPVAVADLGVSQAPDGAQRLPDAPADLTSTGDQTASTVPPPSVGSAAVAQPRPQVANEPAAPTSGIAAATTAAPVMARRGSNQDGDSEERGDTAGGQSTDATAPITPPTPGQSGSQRLSTAIPLAAPRQVNAPVASSSADAVDHVRYVRSLAPNREVQRIALDLDGSMVSVRMTANKVSVDVLSDPGGTLSSEWIRQVERRLDHSVRANAASADQGAHDQAGRQGSAANGGQQQRQQQRPEPLGTTDARSDRWANATRELFAQAPGHSGQEI